MERLQRKGRRAFPNRDDDPKGDLPPERDPDQLPDREPAYQFASLGNAEAFYWADARITCTVVGSLPEAQMQAVAGAVYAQLTGGAPGSAPYYRG